MAPDGRGTSKKLHLPRLLPRTALPDASARPSAGDVRIQHEIEVNPADRDERPNLTVVVLLQPGVHHATASHRPAANSTKSVLTCFFAHALSRADHGAWKVNHLQADCKQTVSQPGASDFTCCRLAELRHRSVERNPSGSCALSAPLSEVCHGPDP